MKHQDTRRAREVPGRSSLSLGVLLCLGVLLFAGLTACDGFDPFQFATFSLDNGVIGQAYADTIRTEGGHGHISMRLVDGQLPPGVGLRVTDHAGILYGQPTRTGDFQFTVEARDSSLGEEPDPADIVTQGFAITVDSL